MRKSSTLFLKFVILLIAVATFTGLAWFPKTEGRAANLDLISIYSDPLIIYIFLASTPFFVALRQAFKLLGYVDKNKIFSQAAVGSVRIIKYCALAIPVFIMGGQAFIVLNANGEDFAGPVALGVYATFASIVIATAVAILEKLLQKAVDMKSENDLTV